MNTLLLILALSIPSAPSDERVLVSNLLSARTERCWTLDRTSNRQVVSVAATGVGFYAYARASQLGVITGETASAWIRKGFDEMLRVNVGNDGWLYHFVNTRGMPALDTEVSSIDSTIFYAGAEKAARLLKNQSLLDHILKCKEGVRLDVMIDAAGYFYHGFTYRNFIRVHSKWSWRHYNEGVLIYKYFGKDFRPAVVNYDLPLFVYFYPLAFYPEEQAWKDNLGKAIDYQIRITGRFGYSAMDSPTGYAVNSPYVVSPLAVRSCERFFPSKSRWMLNQYGVDSLTAAITIDKSWIAQERVYLDDGIALILLGDE